MGDLWRDLVLAARSLARARAFTFVCVLSLSIGMAPVIAIQFGSRVFTMPPPGLDVDGPPALVELVTTPVGPRRATAEWSYADFVDLRDAHTGVTLTGWATGAVDVTLPDSGGTTSSLTTMYVSSNYFDTMRAPIARGPGFQQTTEPVAIVSAGFWQQHLASDPAVVGTTLDVDGVPHVVAGIAPDRFGGHLPFQYMELYLPLERHPRLLADPQARFDRSAAWVHIHGRLTADVSVEQATAAVGAITTELAREHPASSENLAGIVAPYHPLGNLERSEFAIIRAVWQTMTLVPLIVVCLNISGMVQVRTAMRERELSIRQAIGASRGRLMRYLLAESIVLAAAGGTLASVVLFNLPPLVSWWMGEPMPPQLEQALSVDVSMIAVAAGLCLATSLLCGWLPALRFSRPAIMTVLKDEAGTGGIRAGRVHRVTSALQIGIAVPLLVLCAMSLERVRATATADLGFDADLVHAAPIPMRTTEGETAAFQVRRVRDALAQAGGVANVTVADGLPLDFRYRMARVSAESDTGVLTSVSTHVTRVDDGYLETMGIRLLGGRAFRRDDGPGSEPVTIVSKPLADRLFGGADALGRRIAFESPGAEGAEPRSLLVIGVVADFPTSQMSTEREQLLLPLAQHANVRRDGVPVNDDGAGVARLMLVARSAPGESPVRMAAALERVLREQDPQFDRARIVSGVSLRERSMDDFLTQSAVAGMAGGVALLLAALGIYGVVGLMVRTRTREIAVRVTLGASRRRVIGLVLIDVLRLVAPGVVLGLLATMALVRLDGGILGVPLSQMEPLAYVIGVSIAVATAVLAGLSPARRAASVPPMVAMRST